MAGGTLASELLKRVAQAGSGIALAREAGGRLQRRQFPARRLGRAALHRQSPAATRSDEAPRWQNPSDGDRRRGGDGQMRRYNDGVDTAPPPRALYRPGINLVSFPRRTDIFARGGRSAWRHRRGSRQQRQGWCATGSPAASVPAASRSPVRAVGAGGAAAPRPRGAVIAHRLRGVHMFEAWPRAAPQSAAGFAG